MWAALPGWRLSGEDAEDGGVAFLTDDGEVEFAPLDARSDDRTTIRSSNERIESTRARVEAAISSDGSVWVAEAGRTARLRPLTRRQTMEHRLAAKHPEAVATDPEARAPMPGSVVVVHVADGARVAQGDVIASIEAMKMEHPVLAPHDGTVHLLVAQGDQVRRDQPVARVEAEESHD